jgi:hypothetical protein
MKLLSLIIFVSLSVSGCKTLAYGTCLMESISDDLSEASRSTSTEKSKDIKKDCEELKSK